MGWMTNQGIVRLFDILKWDLLGRWCGRKNIIMPNDIQYSYEYFLSLLQGVSPINIMANDLSSWGEKGFYTTK